MPNFPSVISLATSASPEARPSSGGDRKKWEAGVPLVLSAAQQTLEDTSLMTIGKSFPPESEQAHSFPYNCSLSITPSVSLYFCFWFVCLLFCFVLFFCLRANSRRSYTDGCATGRCSQEDVGSKSRLSGAEGT